jgi:PAS domain S-box-containing protein
MGNGMMDKEGASGMDEVNSRMSVTNDFQRQIATLEADNASLRSEIEALKAAKIVTEDPPITDLPQTNAPLPEKVPPPESDAPIKHILFVEDDRMLVKITCFALEKAIPDVRVTHFPDAENALNALALSPSMFDVVLTDHHLTGMSGLEFCREIIRRNMLLPVVIITGEKSGDVAVEAFKAGSSDYIIKDKGEYLNLLPFVLSEAVRNYRNSLARKHAEEENRAILTTVSSGVIVIDSQSRIRRFNPAAERIFGYAARDVIGQDVAMLMPEPLANRHGQYVQRYLKTRSKRILSTRIEQDGRRRDGSIFPIELTVNEMQVGSQWLFVGVFSDISERKAAEAALVTAKESAESANRVKSEFMTRISHEIRTPLNAILGMAELLKNTTDLSDKQRQFIGNIAKAGENLVMLINDVLDFSKIESGKLALNPVNFDLPALVERTVSLFDEQTRNKGVELTCLIHYNTPARAFGDPDRLAQILINLLSNAVKFTERGRIELTLRALDKSDERMTLRFDIMDTGVGIAPRHIEKIFDSFSQADGSSTRKFEGMGMGLTIARHLVEMMKGEIHVESQFEKGTRFWFTVELGPESADAPSEKERIEECPIRGSFPCQVLLVEDNPVNQEVAKGILDVLGCRVDVATDGMEAVDAFGRSRYDLVFMDCQMPEMDGYEATRQMRKYEQAQERSGNDGSRTPIVALTAHAMKGDRERCLEAGMDDFLSKPFNLNGMKTILNRWLAGRVCMLDARNPDADKPSRPEMVQPADLNPPEPARPEASEPEPVQVSGPVDINVLDNIRKLQRKNRPDILSRIIGHYLSHSPGLLKDIETAISQGNRQVIEDSAHSLKSSSGNVGAMVLFEMCRELEFMSKKGDVSLAGPLFSKIQEEYQAVTAFLENELKSG